MLERVWRKRNPLHCWECKLVQSLWRTAWSFLIKLKIGIPHDLAISCLHISELFQKDTFPSMFIATILTITKIWTQPKCPLRDERVKKMWCIYIYNGILLSHKKERNNAICGSMDESRDFQRKTKII